MSSVSKPIFRALTSLTVVYAAAFAGLEASLGGLQGWYLGAPKPAWCPAPWLFGVLPLFVFGLLGIAATLAGSLGRRSWLVIGALLVAELAWRLTFFSSHFAGSAALGIAVTALAVWTSIALGRARRLAGWLTLPFVLWGCLLTAEAGWMARFIV